MVSQDHVKIGLEEIRSLKFKKYLFYIMTKQSQKYKISICVYSFISSLKNDM